MKNRLSWQSILRKLSPKSLQKGPQKRLSPPGPIAPKVDAQTNMILGRTLNRSTSNVLKCTLIDEHGRVKIGGGDFRRSDLLLQHGLLPRDLRKLDVSTHNIVPTILVRDKSILVNLLHIRALIKSNLVLLFENTAPAVDPKLHSLFLYDIEHRLRQTSSSGLPYEIRALEAILVSVVTALDSELNVHEVMVGDILAGLEKSLARDKLRSLLVQSKQLSAFIQKSSLIRDALQELVDNDKDLCGLYLTSKAQGRPLTEDDDLSEVEVMLESYYGHCDEIVQAAMNLGSNIQSTEEIINILQDSNRNELMVLELRFQIGMLGLSFGSAVAALFGMNLQNPIEETNWGFFAVTSVVAVSSLWTVIRSLRRLEKLRHVHIYTRTDSKRERNLGM